MLDDLVDALSKFGILVGEKLRANSDVARAPALAAIVTAINATGRHRDQHSFRVRGIEHDRVQTQSAATRLPSRLVLVIEQAVVRLPRLATIARFKERRRLDTGVDNVWLGHASGSDLPDLRERAT